MGAFINVHYRVYCLARLQEVRTRELTSRRQARIANIDRPSRPRALGSVRNVERSMTPTHAGLWLGVSLLTCCLSVNGGNAQQATMGATDVDGLYQSADEPTPPVAKPRIHKRAPPQMEKQANTSSKLTDWAEQAGREQAEDDRLKRKLKICQNC